MELAMVYWGLVIYLERYNAKFGPSMDAWGFFGPSPTFSALTGACSCLPSVPIVFVVFTEFNEVGWFVDAVTVTEKFF